MRARPRVGGPSRHRDSTRSFPAIFAPSEKRCMYALIARGWYRAIDLHGVRFVLEFGESTDRSRDRKRRGSFDTLLSVHLYYISLFVEIETRCLIAKRVFSFVWNEVFYWTHFYIFILSQGIAEECRKSKADNDEFTISRCCNAYLCQTS